MPYLRNVVIFLQNAWSPLYAGSTWPRESWMKALKTSRSGKRLVTLWHNLEACENTTPQVASWPGGKLPPDPEHIKEILLRRQPEIVVACGRQAQEAIKPLWHGNLLVVPHPASRLLTDALYRKANEVIHEGCNGRWELRQHRRHSRLVGV